MSSWESWETGIFDKFNLTSDERKFIEEANNASAKIQGFTMGDQYKVLTSFYLAKQIEASNISNDKHSKAIRLLTRILCIVGILQVIIMAYQILK